MSRDWLALRLEAPLMSFGGEAIDQLGPTRAYPSASMLTGLIANALGWRWQEREALQLLQDRLVFAAATLRPATILTDTQNAWLQRSDRGWTTHGQPEGRTGGRGSYNAPHRRRRDYLEDGAVLVALSLCPADSEPDLAAVEAALRCPARPLFIGRKSCLPSCPVLAGRVRAASAHGAIARLARQCRAIWPEGHGPEGSAVLELADRRDWQSGLHGGQRCIIEGELP